MKRIIIVCLYDVDNNTFLVSEKINKNSRHFMDSKLDAETIIPLSGYLQLDKDNFVILEERQRIGILKIGDVSYELFCSRVYNPDDTLPVLSADSPYRYEEYIRVDRRYGVYSKDLVFANMCRAFKSW